MIISREVFHQTLAIIPIFFNELAMGLSYAWVPPTLRLHAGPNTELSLDNEQCSWIGSLHELGRIFGPFLASFLLDTFGRQKSLIICTITYFIIWPPVLLTRSISILYAVRFIFGLAVGLNDVCSSIYICENCNPKLRAIFGSVSVLCFFAGELIEYILVTYLSYQTVAIINTIFTCLTLSSILVNTETAHHLITSNKLEKAEKNFNWLRGKAGDVRSDEFLQLKKFVEQENSVKVDIRELFVNRVYYKPTVLILILCILMMMSGFSAIASFVSEAFTESTILTPNQFTILFGVCQLISGCVSPFLISKFKRKTILISSFGFAAATHLVTAATYWITSRGFSIECAPWIIFVSITTYAMANSFGMLPIFYIIRGELFPQNIKSVGGSIAVLGHSIMGFLTSKMFLIAAEALGMYVNFLAFAISSAGAVFFVYKWIPETGGKTLEEIQKEIGCK